MQSMNNSSDKTTVYSIGFPTAPKAYHYDDHLKHHLKPGMMTDLNTKPEEFNWKIQYPIVEGSYWEYHERRKDYKLRVADEKRVLVAEKKETQNCK